MTPEQFNNLDEAEQAETVWDGVQIADRFEEEYHVILYQIDNLYVEVYYHQEHNFIRRLNAFTKLELLDIYIEKLNLEELI